MFFSVSNFAVPPVERISIPNSDFEMKSEMVIKALGFDPENLPKLFNSQNLSVS